MKHLTQFIDNRNQWNAIFNKPAVTFPLSQQDINRIADSIDCELSPENLHCDGEITPAEAHRKGQYLNRVLKELEQYATRMGMTLPTVWERW